MHYKSDSDSDCYEKIVFCPVIPLTHKNDLKYLYKNNDNKLPEYPKFISFNSFDFIGKITIGKNVSEDSKKAYKFFKEYKSEEADISQFQEDSEKGTEVILNSKREVYYAMNIVTEILAPNCSEEPLLYIPINININSALNEFMPLRNDDTIKVSAANLTACNSCEIISNSAIGIEKAQKQLLQRHLLGAKENCEVAYTQEDEDEVYSIRQENKKNDNSIFIHNKNGIFLTYKAKDS